MICKDSYRAGASALRVWAADLDGAQGQADRALTQGRQARVSDLAARYTDTPPRKKRAGC